MSDVAQLPPLSALMLRSLKRTHEMYLSNYGQRPADNLRRYSKSQELQHQHATLLSYLVHLYTHSTAPRPPPVCTRAPEALLFTLQRPASAGGEDQRGIQTRERHAGCTGRKHRRSCRGAKEWTGDGKDVSVLTANASGQISPGRRLEQGEQQHSSRLLPCRDWWDPHHAAQVPVDLLHVSETALQRD